MSRLPSPGGDSGNWGNILNDFLSQEHNPDGSLKKAGDIATAKSDAEAAQSAVAAKYTFPTGGIPAADLNATVVSYLADAQTAVQGVNGKTGQSISLGLDDLSNVDVSGVTDGQALTRAGINWTPQRVATLGVGGLVPMSQLASGTPDGTKFVRDDGTLATAGTNLGVVVAALSPSKTAAQNQAAGQAAIDAAAPTNGTAFFPPGTHPIPVTGTVFTVPTGVTVWMADDCVLDASAAAAGASLLVFQLLGSEAASNAGQAATGFSFLTSEAKQGDTVLSVQDASQYAVDNYVKVGSSEFWDPGSRNTLIGEIGVVSAVNTGTNTVTLSSPLVGGSYYQGGRVTSSPSTLSAAIDNVTTTIPLVNATVYRWPTQNMLGLVQIDSEQINFAHKNEWSLLGCTRGVNGTTAASHSSGASVTELPFTKTLSGAIDNSQTTITLNNVTALTNRNYYQIDSEVIYCPTISGSQLTACTRGACGTTAASHSDGATVTLNYAGFVAKLTTVDNVTIRGGVLQGPPLPASDNNSIIGIQATGTVGLRVIETRFVNVKMRSIDLYDCVEFLVDRIRSYGSNRNNYGYGVAMSNACQDGKVISCHFRQDRHGTTIGADPLIHGVARRILIAHNHSWDSTASTYDTHSGTGDNITFLGCFSYDAGDSGFWMNGPNIAIIGCTVIRPTNNGMFLQNLSVQPSDYKIEGNSVYQAQAGFGIYYQTENSSGRPCSGAEVRCLSFVNNDAFDSFDDGFKINGGTAGSGQITRLPNVTLVGNRSRRTRRNSSQFGFDLLYLDEAAITGNTVTDGLYDSFRLSNCNGCVLTGNVASYRIIGSATAFNLLSCVDCSLTGNRGRNAFVGIAFDNSSSNCTAMVNNVRGCTTTISRGTGSGHIIKTTDGATAGDYNRL